MITNLTASQNLFLANVNRIEHNLESANQQLSSGKRVNVASDAPEQIGNLLQLNTNLQRNNQIQSNLTMALTDAQAADSALTSAAGLMDTAIQLATQGANGTQTAANRLSMAQRVQGLLEQMVTYSQTQVTGRYIFSGDQDQNPTFQVDLSAASGTGVDQLSNAAATKQIENPTGGSFVASQNAQTIFNNTATDGTMPAADNVFAALNQLLTALNSNDQKGCAAVVVNLHLAADHLNNMDAFYGTLENRIQAATTFASRYSTQLQAEIGSIQDADAAAAALAETQATIQLQAVFEMRAKMPNSSLFNYLG